MDLEVNLDNTGVPARTPKEKGEMKNLYVSLMVIAALGTALESLLFVESISLAGVVEKENATGLFRAASLFTLVFATLAALAWTRPPEAWQPLILAAGGIGIGIAAYTLADTVSYAAVATTLVLAPGAYFVWRQLTAARPREAA